MQLLLTQRMLWNNGTLSNKLTLDDLKRKSVAGDLIEEAARANQLSLDELLKQEI